MVLRAAACLALSGCLWATPTSDVLTGYDGRVGPRGASAHVVGGIAGMHADLEADGRGYQRAGDPNTYPGGGLGLSVRLSPLGMLPTTHRVERYFDFGSEVGGEVTLVVGIPTTATTLGQGWVGGWAELGTVPIGNGYLALVGNVRAATASAPWRDQTVVTIGVGWRVRRRATLSDLTWRD
jgi:hypothetical protein